MLKVPDWRLEGWGHLELNIKDDVGGCSGAYFENFIKIGPDYAEKSSVWGFADVLGFLTGDLKDGVILT